MTGPPRDVEDGESPPRDEMGPPRDGERLPRAASVGDTLRTDAHCSADLPSTRQRGHTPLAKLHHTRSRNGRTLFGGPASRSDGPASGVHGPASGQGTLRTDVHCTVGRGGGQLVFLQDDFEMLTCELACVDFWRVSSRRVRVVNKDNSGCDQQRNITPLGIETGLPVQSLLF